MNPSLRLPEFRYTQTTLANGLDVIVRRQGHLPIVAVNLWYHVGSKDEERRQRGFAHLFEHLMFEGSEHYPGDFFKPLQRIGASLNGSTSSDRTNYFEDVPAAHVELALAMESDRMGHLLPALTDEKLRIQKDVVKNEYRQNYANRPYGQVWRLLAEALYPPSHPYNWLTIGAMEDVEAATRADVEAFFRRYYVPSNASLAIVGAVDQDRALDLADRYFGPLTGGTKARARAVPFGALEDDVEILVRDRVELDRVYLAWHSVKLFHADDAPLVLLADILARGRSSRLYRKLVMEEGLAQDVAAHQSGRELAGSFNVIVTLRPGRPPEAARARVLEELADLAGRGPSDDELTRVRTGRVAGFIYALDNVGGFGGVADRLNAYNTYLGDPGRITSDVARYQEVTAEEIR
ncbi:MAG TPA: pitrilysin family protein, partial [Isosphaeraceae bacterium]